MSKLEGVTGPVFKSLTINMDFCQVDMCGKQAFYDVHIKMNNKVVKGITVAMCREHGDYATPVTMDGES